MMKHGNNYSNWELSTFQTDSEPNSTKSVVNRKLWPKSKLVGQLSPLNYKINCPETNAIIWFGFWIWNRNGWTFVPNLMYSPIIAFELRVLRFQWAITWCCTLSDFYDAKCWINNFRDFLDSSFLKQILEENLIKCIYYLCLTTLVCYAHL